MHRLDLGNTDPQFRTPDRSHQLRTHFKSGSVAAHADYFAFAAAALVTLAVVGFELQLLSVSGLLDIRFLRSVAYHGTWALAIVLTAFLLIVRRGAVRQILPVLLACALCTGITLIHPIDEISRSFLVALLLTFCGTVLATFSAPLALARLSASATVLAATFCLLDILFARGFTEIVGRAAGLSINPNAAAAGLLLGAASSFWTIPRDWRASFVLVVAAAILTTLSRSMFLATILISLAVGIPLLRDRLRSPATRPPFKWLRTGVLCLCLAGWVGTAYWANPRFSRTMSVTVQQISEALPAFRRAQKSVSAEIGAVKSRVGEREASSTPDPAADASLAQIARRAYAEGVKNSLAARGLYFEAAVLAYRTGPPLGRGLAAAHALSPHNSFLMFAIAFGHLGWLIPICFLVLCAFWVRSIEQAPIILATSAVLMTSHDVLLVPGLLLPIILGMAALRARLASEEDHPCGAAAIKYGVLAAPVLFALGWLLGTSLPLSAAKPPPAMLWIQIFCASVLWATAIWRWSDRPRQTS
jgi:hypothetical protein